MGTDWLMKQVIPGTMFIEKFFINDKEKSQIGIAYFFITAIDAGYCKCYFLSRTGIITFHHRPIASFEDLNGRYWERL